VLELIDDGLESGKLVLVSGPSRAEKKIGSPLVVVGKRIA
jgi:hypothetical protein